MGTGVKVIKPANLMMLSRAQKGVREKRQCGNIVGLFMCVRNDYMATGCRVVSM